MLSSPLNLYPRYTCHFINSWSDFVFSTSSVRIIVRETTIAIIRDPSEFPYWLFDFNCIYKCKQLWALICFLSSFWKGMDLNAIKWVCIFEELSYKEFPNQVNKNCITTSLLIKKLKANVIDILNYYENFFKTYFKNVLVIFTVMRSILENQTLNW